MLGKKAGGQGQLFYRSKLDEKVPDDHLLRKIDAVLDLSELRVQLAPHYSHTGRPSIDPELMIRMLLIGGHSARMSDHRERFSTHAGLTSGFP